MPRRGDRGGAQTRARIAAVANEMFLAHGFEQVTTAEVAAAAGVSRVTLFKYFDRKEDLLFDQLPAAVEHVRAAVGQRPEGTDVVDAVRLLAVDLAERRHPLSGLSEGADPFIRLVVSSPVLIARLREFEHEVEAVLAAELAKDASTRELADLAAAMLVAAYRTVAVATYRRRVASIPLNEVAERQRAEIEQASAVLEHGLGRSGAGQPRPAGLATAKQD